MKKMVFSWLVFLVLMAKAEDGLMDTNLARNAVAVVRVKLIVADNPGSATPFRVYSVHTIRILKNESHGVFRDLLVRAFKDKPGVPEEECTIYLQRYDPISQKLTDDKDYGLWILVGGDATNGVSNVEGKMTEK